MQKQFQLSKHARGSSSPYWRDYVRYDILKPSYNIYLTRINIGRGFRYWSVLQIGMPPIKDTQSHSYFKIFLPGEFLLNLAGEKQFMRLLTYTYGSLGPALGFLDEGRVFPMQVLEGHFQKQLPTEMLAFVQGSHSLLNELNTAFDRWKHVTPATLRQTLSRTPDAEGLKILAPLPNPTSFRDAYAFRQHVETSRMNRGLEMIPEFDDFPVFYFSNHQIISGSGEIAVQEMHLDGLDYELEIAIVINREGKNISAEQADEYIGGFMILNDWSARKLQMDEMKLNLGPAKGKDFATSMGPLLVTPDELEPYRIEPLPGHRGKAYNLEMKARVNGELLSQGNFQTMHWTFAEIIERVSYGVTLYPGDIIGSGTVGTGCLLELNGTGARMDPENFKNRWLQPGDRIELEIDHLGTLCNTITLL